MRAAQYVVGGSVEIASIPDPSLPGGGLLVKTLACGLCSGELMDWYLDRKAPHVLGHEVCGEVIASDDARFPVGTRVFPHHHAPCMNCEHCKAGHHVHCPTWKRTNLMPGGMAERFAVSAELLADCLDVGDMRAVDAALIEPLGCVLKSIARAGVGGKDRIAVVGLGGMGLMHAICLRKQTTGFDVNPQRIEWAASKGIDARTAVADGEFDVVFVCPGTPEAISFAVSIAAPQARIVLFAPLAPGCSPDLNWGQVYFRDLNLLHCYSCGPNETRSAAAMLAGGTIRAEDVVSHFVELSELPAAYNAMKRGEILKAMVIFP